MRTPHGVEPGCRRRVLVTGSRGKSSVVRLLFAVMQSAGLQAYARITGVVPRELGPDGVRRIARSAGAHVEEMRWWLGQLPASAQGIVLENSAIAPEFQGLAGSWLKPGLTVLTNVWPDHQESWGADAACAAGVLAAGVPRGGEVILPAGLQTDAHLLALLEQRRCHAIFATPAESGGEHFRDVNMGLALAASEQLGFAAGPALEAMRRLPRDRYDFHVAQCCGAEVAMAFSANDITSTRELFRSLTWSPEETRLVYNHRKDRPGRLGSFVDWFGQSSWREVLIIGDKPARRPVSASYLDIKDERALLRLFQPGDRIFGCGNIAGLPISLSAVLGR